jgi:DNA-binding MarR family transcriptional regulator
VWVSDHDGSVGSALSPVLAKYTNYLMRRAFAHANRLSMETVTEVAHPRDYLVLGVLAEKNAYSQQDLAERLGINRTVMVKLIDRLEDAGSVLRSRNPTDRRSYVLSLTEQGRRAMTDMLPAIAHGDDRLVAPLAAAERDRLTGLLQQLLPGLDSTAGAQVSYLIAQAHHSLRRRADDALAELGLAARHFGALAVLDEHGPCPQSELAAQLGVTEASAVPIVDDLEQRGLVSRARDRTDRRRYALELTPAGRDRFDAARGCFDALQTELRATLGEDGDAELRRLLAALTASG